MSPNYWVVWHRSNCKVTQVSMSAWSVQRGSPHWRVVILRNILYVNGNIYRRNPRGMIAKLRDYSLKVRVTFTFGQIPAGEVWTSLSLWYGLNYITAIFLQGLIRHEVTNAVSYAIEQRNQTKYRVYSVVTGCYSKLNSPVCSSI